MGKYPSILQAEVFAITSLANIKFKRRTVKRPKVIYSNSQPALKVISLCSSNTKNNLRILTGFLTGIGTDATFHFAELFKETRVHLLFECEAIAGVKLMHLGVMETD
ncbi:unnamed protein product [Ceratitis capitata]|uniref:(Mediterranean fruit fly) hypothetical protein n=1 Tax=Ceratitis capitata TaxID=7213 RepID=A0A811UGA9_CERCA|nr:unnamed protein product [Ceratitis capitata]